MEILAFVLLGGVVLLVAWIYVLACKRLKDLTPKEREHWLGCGTRRLILFAVTLLSAHTHASAINPTSQPIPNDAQGAFMAAGGFQAVVNDLVIVYGIAPTHPVWGKWYVRIPLETAEAFGYWYLVQSQTGAVETKENDANRATCAAWGALGTSAAMCAESWDFGLGGCK